MRSKAEIPNKTDFMKYSVNNFLENERIRHHLENELPLETGYVFDDAADQSSVVNKRTVPDESWTRDIAFSKVTVEPRTYAPVRFITTCYLKCVQQPYWHSQTIYVTLGSTKRHYYENALFQHKLVPSHWRESMHTEIHPEKRSTYKSTIDIPIEPEEFHYISLEPQQDIANRRALVTEI